MSGVHAAVPSKEPAAVPTAMTAVIALGSNQGDREGLLRDAVRAIGDLDGVRVIAASGIVETPALKLNGVDESAPSYLNAVVIAEAALQPEELLQQLHGIEAHLGRVRDEVWGDRTIDLDLIDFGGLARHNDTIMLPHPRAWQRAFVLAPWVQVQPHAVLVSPASSTGEIGHTARVSDTGPHSDTEPPTTSGPIAGLLAATTDTVTVYPAPSLMEVLAP